MITASTQLGNNGSAGNSDFTADLPETTDLPETQRVHSDELPETTDLQRQPTHDLIDNIGKTGRFEVHESKAYLDEHQKLTDRAHLL